jgi:hypothetical protein
MLAENLEEEKREEIRMEQEMEQVEQPLTKDHREVEAGLYGGVFKCQFPKCNKRFTTKFSLKRHYYIHSH